MQRSAYPEILLASNGAPHMAVRNCDPAALATWRPDIAARHVGGGRHLVEEYEGVGIEFVLDLELALALGPNIRPLLLGGMERVFCA